MPWCLMVAHTGMYFLQWKLIQITYTSWCLFVKENTKTGREICELQMRISACGTCLQNVEGIEIGKSELRNYFLHASMNVTIFLVARRCCKSEVMYKVLSHL